MTNRLALSLVSLALLAGGCGEKIDPVQLQPECPTSPVSWDGEARDVFGKYCARCHSSQLGGSARNGAPAAFNYDTYKSAVASSTLADLAAGVGSGMPPSAPLPTDAERKLIHCWVKQGTLEKAPKVVFNAVLLDSLSSAPVSGAYVAIEKGGQYVPIADPSKGSPAYQFGALTDEKGAFSVLVAQGTIGIHTFHAGYYYGTEKIEATTNPTSATIRTTRFPPETAKPTLTGARAEPNTVAPGGTFILSATATAGDSKGPLSDEIIAVEPSTGWAAALDPPSPGVPGTGYPDGLYKRTITAPGNAGTYTYGLTVTSEGCVTGDPVTVTVTVK